MSEFTQRHGTEWNLTMAASVLFILPVIILFFLAQRVFVEGVTLTGVKG
jgi:multiple sugar transport system permease protein